jgi:AcrR family transcriptional regulator
MDTEQIVARRADAVANQARVLEAAREVFAEQGLAAEIKDIADRAGVGVATVYRGFGSKDGLREATIERANVAVSDLLAAAENATDPTESIRLLVTGLLGYAESYGWLIQASLAGEATAHRSAQEQAEKRRRVERIIARAISGEAGRKLSPDVVRLLIEGTVVALTFRARRQEPHPPVAEIAEGIVAMLSAAARQAK